jgi:putative spermidine/putrescine transport system ATP-binding protein
MAFIDLKHLRKNFGSTTVVQDFSLAIEKGEFVTFLGPSGCGKTTILRMIAGFETVTSGSIEFDGVDMTATAASKRRVGMVFQAYALFPNMTVAENIAFGLRIAKWSASERKRRVDEMLTLIKLPQIAARYPYQLSGGQQQRVALARALAPQPQALLLDEPLSALDAKIRVALRDEIRALQKRLGITTVFVTHDQEEALSISDRIVVMNEGRAEQIGSPAEIYNKPKTKFVASFIGTLNLLDATVVDTQHGLLSVGGQNLTTSGELNGARVGERKTLAIRPESLSFAQGQNGLLATLDDVNFLGSIVRMRLRGEDFVLSLDQFNRPNLKLPELGERLSVSIAPEDVIVVD